MASMHVLYDDEINNYQATPVASAEVATYPSSNLASYNYAEVYRSGSADSTPVTLDVDFGEAVAISAIGLGNVNFRSTATVLLEGHSDETEWGGSPTVSETIDCGALDGYVRCLYKHFTESSLRYWRLTITDDGNPDAFLEIGRMILGTHVEMYDNFDQTNAKNLSHNNILHRTETNQVYSYEREWAWEFNLSWKNAFTTTLNQLRSLNFSVKGSYAPFFLVLDPDPAGDGSEPSEVYYVRINGRLSNSKIKFDRFTLGQSFIEETVGVIAPR